MKVVLGTRASRLARAQTQWVADTLNRRGATCAVEAMETRGDLLADRPIAEVGGKGVFTAELESALRSGGIDAAVHSLKDLPTDPVPGLTIGAVVNRIDARDVLVSGGTPFADLPLGTRVGTSSVRRAAQLRALRSDLSATDIRGNVETRVAKVNRGEYAATILAAAGLLRLGMEAQITEWFEPERLTPAPGQGALAIQCRDDHAELLLLLGRIDDPVARATTTAERAVLARLDGGCTAPIAAHATVDGDALWLLARVSAPDGSEQVSVTERGATHAAGELGLKAAGALLQLGADRWV